MELLTLTSAHWCCLHKNFKSLSIPPRTKSTRAISQWIVNLSIYFESLYWLKWAGVTHFLIFYYLFDAHKNANIVIVVSFHGLDVSFYP